MERLTAEIAGNNYGKCRHLKRSCPDDCAIAEEPCEGLQDIFDRLAAYEDTGLKPEQIREANHLIASAFDLCCKHSPDTLLRRLKDILVAEAEGRLVVLPCKVGDTIYILRGDVKNGYETVKKTHVEEVQFRLGCLDKQTKLYPFYYLTRAEAEAALKGVSKDA